MIIITGAAGFISSCLLSELNRRGETDIILVDDFSSPKKAVNYRGKSYIELVNRMAFFKWAKGKEDQIRKVFHLGARTDTTEKDWEIFRVLNLDYSKRMWRLCAKNKIPLIYASSAATYGGGEHGFSDDHAGSSNLAPLNPYGRSKQDFDLWALGQSAAPPYWAGLKFFNVYGPNEYHKGRMASVVLHAFRQIRESGQMKLFRSHRSDYQDGEQKRDFIYVKDVIDVMLFLMEKQGESGLYNLGTGQARTFNDLVRAIFSSLDMETDISYIDTPEDIRDTYQYFTEAEMGKLRAAAYAKHFTSLEDGVQDYVQSYLTEEKNL